ncbi:MAG: FAD:protein FMN transferase [Thermoguttaceae bacterium]
MTEGTPRRDFLLGRTVTSRQAETGGSARDAAGAGEVLKPSVNEPCLIHLSRQAMAGEFEICLPAAIAGEATAAALESLDLVQSLERQLSFFRPDSDISRINRDAADAAVEVEPRLFALLQGAMQLWRDSGGAYDLTAAPLWEAWGFARRSGAIPSPEQLAQARSLVGGQWVELDDAQKTIRLLCRGVRLNLGSIGKGYAVDRAVEHLLAAGVSDFLVHGGYSSVAARGSAGGPATLGAASDIAAAPTTARQPWKIGVKDPLHDELRLGQVELHDRALGTSGAQFQSFRHQGRRYGHILDPRTGQPADGVLSVTVLAPTAAEADALSTAFYVMGPQAAMGYCQQHPSIAAMIFAAAGNRWELHHHGLAEESADLLVALTER